MQLELYASKISIAMETTSPTLPEPAGDQILGGGTGSSSNSSNTIPQAVPLVSSSSGSIEPFFAVISVLTVLAFLSCVLGRRLTRSQMVTTPVESISGNDPVRFGLLKRKCRQLQCMVAHHDVEVGSKVMVMDLGQEKKGDAWVKEGDHEVPPQNDCLYILNM